MLNNFSTPVPLELGLFGGFKLEKDIGNFPLFSTDIGGDPVRPGDNAHCDLALVSEFALLIAFFIVNVFDDNAGEPSHDVWLGILESEFPLRVLVAKSFMYFEEPSRLDFLELIEFVPSAIAVEPKSVKQSESNS